MVKFNSRARFKGVIGGVFFSSSPPGFLRSMFLGCKRLQVKLLLTTDAVSRIANSGTPGKTGATPPSHRMSLPFLDTNATVSSASPHSERGSALAVKDGHGGRSTASAVS